MKRAIALSVTLSFALSGLLMLPSCKTQDAPRPAPQAKGAPTQGHAASGAGVAPIDGAKFGKAIEPTTQFVALVDLHKDPKAYAGKRVRTRGEVVAVCQNAGCWADLRPEGDPKTVSVPTHVTMHDHAFLLPKTSKSKLAEIEGTIAVRELSQSECDHYNSEGASLTAGTPILNVDALGVILK